jgi:hypothetical protein
MMLEGALHVSGPQLGSCLQRYGSSLQKAVAQPTPGLTSPRQRSLAQEEAVCLATPTEPAPVREQRLPPVPRLPTVVAANGEAPVASGRVSFAETLYLWRSTSNGAEASGGGLAAPPAASRPLAAALRRLGRRAGLSPGGARALLSDAVGAGASIDAVDHTDELIVCRRTAASIAARVGAAHATRRERRRLALRARLAARDLLAGLGSSSSGGKDGGGGGDGAAA